MPKTRSEITKKLQELQDKTQHGEEKALAKQRAEGKLTARERIWKLLDVGTFVEEFMLAETPSTDFGMAERRRPTDGVITGYGKIEGRTVYVFAQDFTVIAGTVGAAHAEKIAYCIETARKIGVPVIGLYDSAGARIQEGLDVTRAIGRMFYQNSITSGAVPQISAIMGPCIGVAAYSPALTDFIIMVKGTSQMFITGPSVIKEVTGEDVSMEELGGSKIHSEMSGVADVVASNDEECLKQIRELLAYIPSSALQSPPRTQPADDANRLIEDMETLVPENTKKPYDVRNVIRRLADNDGFFELKPKWARNLVTGFGRLNGRPVGFVANQPMFLAGSLDVDCSDKAARFIRFCDAFNIPIVTLVDVPGYLPGTKQERSGIIRHGAKMLYAYAEASVPKITVYLRKGYGGAKQAMCTREMGADQVFVWPGVELAVMGAAGAVGVLYKKEIEQAANPEEMRRQKLDEFSERFSGPFEALAKQYAHSAIMPSETRVRLIQALEMLETKQEDRPRKKHGLMPV
ncbi:MAG TPA: acyl-CoA carboxylase subunit beta [Terriglobia bacterium]|nr:acyl-CoA carboxylase subunit beta [Terriglobia bacterium]